MGRIPTILPIMTSRDLSVRLYTRAMRVLPGVVAGGVLCLQVGMRIRGGG
jgi:hypothetical protein